MPAVTAHPLGRWCDECQREHPAIRDRQHLAELRIAAAARKESMPDRPDTPEEEADRADWVDQYGWPELMRRIGQLDAAEPPVD